MEIVFNKEFEQLCQPFNIPVDLNFTYEIPGDIQKILDDEIISNAYGVSLKSITIPSEFDGHYALNQAQQEDLQNHFHVSSNSEKETTEEAFRLGIITLKKLAERFVASSYKDIHFWYYFQSKEMRRLWNKRHGFIERDNELFISDRLSFYTEVV
ncbi:hypothetical protein [Xanthocytophaga flava]|uniref:hypothetical protein n=1 Tax=Xanthocytophaga flava TaxID=3048013 RepID=UPI0028D331A6|nr:hypothetical protein [Xanthocytophaga flavus]MDJ1471977.1 hypothetical protein [Xanthocytophaga flavus]